MPLLKYNSVFFFFKALLSTCDLLPYGCGWSQAQSWADRLCQTGRQPRGAS